MKIKVRIAVAANRHGDWHAYGFKGATSWQECMDAFEMIDDEQQFWVEAEIEVADERPTFQGESVPHQPQ